MDPEAIEPPPPPPVLPGERHLVVPRIARDRAEARILAEICDGPFRPPDARVAATIEPAQALFVPFWRVDIRRWDDAKRLEEERLGYAGIPVGLGPGDPSTAWMVCAQRAFPYEIKHPGSMIPSDSRPVLVHASSLQPGDPDPSYGWTIVDADVDQGTGRALAIAAYRRLSLDAGALLAQLEQIETAVHTLHFVWYPVWFARYRYQGQNAPTRDGLFHVGISAVDETCIAAVHPSKLQAGAARIKKLFGFGG